MPRSEAAHQDAEAFCAAAYPQLVGALSLYVGDRFLAEELAQEALLRACREWPKVSALDLPGGWTWRVATNLANSHFRRRQVARRAQRRLEASTESSYVDPDGGTAVEVRRAVAALPERQRAAFVLRHVQELAVEETAARMDISADAVRSLTKRATATLRGQLGDLLPVSSKETRDA